MTNQTQLKNDIARIARKEAKVLIAPLLKRLAVYRHDIAALKRERGVLARSRKAIAKGRSAQASISLKEASDAYSADALIALRSRLGLTAREFGLLIDASAMSVYRWESGKGRPRATFLAKLASIRNIGKIKARKLVAIAQQG